MKYQKKSKKKIWIIKKLYYIKINKIPEQKVPRYHFSTVFRNIYKKEAPPRLGVPPKKSYEYIKQPTLRQGREPPATSFEPSHL